jgi:hypothetical protein
LITVQLLYIATVLAIPRGGGDSVDIPFGGGKEPIVHSVVGLQCVERETSESVCPSDMISEEEEHPTFPKRLFDVAKSFLGRATDVIFSKTPLRRPNYDAVNDDGVDHTFDDLDRIIENTNTTTNVELLQHQNYLRDTDDGEECVDDGWLLKTFWPPLAQGVSLLSGRKQQLSLLHRMNKVSNAQKSVSQLSQTISHTRTHTAIEQKLQSSETAKAFKTIRGIIERFPEYGVVDLFGMYRYEVMKTNAQANIEWIFSPIMYLLVTPTNSPKDVAWSFLALSKLQYILEHDAEDEVRNMRLDNDIVLNKRFFEELAHYCSFASAAYGWKGFAFCGRLHPFGGNYRMLARSTGIDRRDIVIANWHSKANRPVSDG